MIFCYILSFNNSYFFWESISNYIFQKNFTNIKELQILVGEVFASITPEKF